MARTAAYAPSFLAKLSPYDRLIHLLTDYDRRQRDRNHHRLALLFEAAQRARNAAGPNGEMLADAVRAEFDAEFPPVKRWLRSL